MAEPFARLRRFLAELKRRSVYQVAVAYAVVGFVLIEAADLIFPALNIPSWAYSLVVVLVLFGFPIALVIAWAFDVTPEGVRRTPAAEVEPGEDDFEASGGGPRTTYKVLVGLGVVAGVVAGSWYLAGHTGTSIEEELDAARVAVFPFTVRSGDDLDHWSEGMVELLGRSLDGAGSLQSVDPNTLLNRVESEPADGLDPDSVRRIAARFGAGRYVQGSIYQLGDSLRLSATWYRTDGEEVGSAEVTGGGEADIQTMVDALARSAIIDLTGGEVERRQRLAARTTSSVEALKAYLAGQRAFRRWDLRAAIESFSEAVDQDSSFALAHYRLALATD